MIRDGEENLNWPSSVLLCRFTARERTNNTVNTTGKTDNYKKWIATDMEERKERKKSISLRWGQCQDGRTG